MYTTKEDIIIYGKREGITDLAQNSSDERIEKEIFFAFVKNNISNKTANKTAKVFFIFKVIIVNPPS